MKRILSILLFLTMSIGAFSQQGKDIVVLKSGVVMVGDISVYKPGEYVRLIQEHNFACIYLMSDVEYIQRGGNVVRKRKTVYNPEFPKEGYEGSVDASMIDPNFEKIFITTTHGYRFNKHVFAGGGAGIFICDEAIEVVNGFMFAGIELSMGKYMVDPFIRGNYGKTMFGDAGNYGSIEIGVRYSSLTLGVIYIKYPYTLRSGYGVEIMSAGLNVGVKF